MPSRDFAAPSPRYAFDPASCNNPIGATDPNCAHVFTPLPVPAVLTPVMPLPSVTPLNARTDNQAAATQLAPAVTSPRPRASARASSSRSRSAHRSDMSAKPSASSERAAAGRAADKKPTTKPVVKRSRNTDLANDPFERLDHMRLQ
jgi:hypothetical protein